jgi:hypothetical protein
MTEAPTGIPMDLWDAILSYWPESEWINAANISKLESGWNQFALNDTTSPASPCGAVIETRDGVKITAERSVGFFQINSCNFPTWDWTQLFGCNHNCGTAHMLWTDAGESWSPWYFSATELGLL